MPGIFPPPKPCFAILRAKLFPLILSVLTAFGCQGNPGSARTLPVASGRAPATAASQPLPSLPPVRFRFHTTTLGPTRTLPAYAVCTGLDDAGAFCHLDRTGRFLPCSSADNIIPKDGRTWCDYGIPIQDGTQLTLDPSSGLHSGRLYLSVDSPLFLRVDETTGGLVQPDPANGTDPNRFIRYDWIEFTLDRSGFHGNTTCVDQFGLPIAMTVTGRADPGHPLGPVGLAQARSELFRAYLATVPPAFASLADPGQWRILAPAHGGFGDGGPDRAYLQPYIDQMWRRYRGEPLVLTPDEGTFTGRVDAQDRIVFTRAGDATAYVIRGKPTSQEAFLGNGVLAAGNGIEKVLGAQITALLNRHLLETPLDWRDAAAYYRREPCNAYARFWHEQGLDHRAYGFAYDDVNDQSSSLATPDPLAVDLAFRWD